MPDPENMLLLLAPCPYSAEGCGKSRISGSEGFRCQVLRSGKSTTGPGGRDPG